MGAYRVLRRSEWEDWTTDEYAEDGSRGTGKVPAKRMGSPNPGAGVRAM